LKHEHDAINKRSTAVFSRKAFVLLFKSTHLQSKLIHFRVSDWNSTITSVSSSAKLDDKFKLLSIFSERELTSVYYISLYAVARPSVICLSSVCLSVTLVHPTQAVQIFGNIYTALGTLAILDIHGKFHGDRPRGTPPPGS